MTDWQKVPPPAKGKAPPHWLEVRRGKFKTRYRVRLKARGLNIRENLPADIQRWEDARDAGEELIAKYRLGNQRHHKNVIPSADLIDEFVDLKKSKSKATYENNEIMARVHIKPFMSERAPLVSDWNASVWLTYKNEFRLRFPEHALFNHYKFFVGIFTLANAKGLMAKVKLDYKEAKDDNREPGQVIPDDEFRAFLATANQKWRDRSLIQRITGQRPSVIRRLKKEFVDFKTGIVSIPKSESKNRRSYQFKLPQAALDILKTRLENGSPYFFPSGEDLTQPMDKHIKGWHSAWKRALDPRSEGIELPGYTPHDLRHTFLTEKVNTPGTNLAVLCYSCDLSLEELMRTYVHFKPEDTQSLADESDKMADRFGVKNGQGVDL